MIVLEKIVLNNNRVLYNLPNLGDVYIVLDSSYTNLESDIKIIWRSGKFDSKKLLPFSAAISLVELSFHHVFLWHCNNKSSSIVGFCNFALRVVVLLLCLSSCLFSFISTYLYRVVLKTFQCFYVPNKELSRCDKTLHDWTKALRLWMWRCWMWMV